MVVAGRPLVEGHEGGKGGPAFEGRCPHTLRLHRMLEVHPVPARAWPLGHPGGDSDPSGD